jgi:hypothetical protein
LFYRKQEDDVSRYPGMPEIKIQKNTFITAYGDWALKNSN